MNSPLFGEQMISQTINHLTSQQLNTLALAMDFFVCNGTMPQEFREEAEALLVIMDGIAEDHESRPLDNLLVVNFTPNND